MFGGDLWLVAATVLLAPVVLWLCFVPLFWVLGRAHVEKRTPFWWEWCVALPAFIVGYPLDVLVNIIYGTLLFWQWPHYKRLLLSPRMDDLILNGSGWRKAQALAIVGRFLEPFDATGQHSTHGFLK